MRKITPNQANLIKFIHEYRITNSTAPTLQEMVEGLGVSDNKSILGILEALEKQGYVEREKKKSRSITLTEKGQDFLRGYLLPWEYRRGDNPAPADQLRQAAEMMRTSVTVSSPTSESLAYQDNSIRADGTTIGSDLKTIVETAVSLAINRYFGTANTTDAKPVGAKIGDGVSAALGRLLSHSTIAEHFGWAMLLAGLTWINLQTLSGITALVYSVVEVVIIKYLLTK